MLGEAEIQFLVICQIEILITFFKLALFYEKAKIMKGDSY
jgi:hypothetical protein